MALHAPSRKVRLAEHIEPWRTLNEAHVSKARLPRRLPSRFLARIRRAKNMHPHYRLWLSTNPRFIESPHYPHLGRHPYLTWLRHRIAEYALRTERGYNSVEASVFLSDGDHAAFDVWLAGRVVCKECRAYDRGLDDYLHDALPHHTYDDPTLERAYQNGRTFLATSGRTPPFVQPNRTGCILH